MNINHRKTGWQHGIQARMIFMLLLTTTIIFGGFMLMYYETTRTKMNREISVLSDFFANHLSISLINPLWNLDSNSCKDIMNATMNEKQVRAIFVKNKKGKVVVGKIRNERWESIGVDQTFSFNDCIARQREIVRENEKIGMVAVCLTPKFMKEKLNDAIMKMLITLAILDTLLFIMLFFGIRKIVISPIRMIAEYLSRISVGDMPEQITEKSKGEFDEIRKCLNMLIDATDQTTLAAEEIAAGNLTIAVRERSEHDRMTQALNRMIRRLKEIMNETDAMLQAVGHGKLDIRECRSV